MELSFVKTSPSKNTTLLVSTPVPRSLHREVARRLMDPEIASAEQVCFRESSSVARERMQMMGGEFCVNAAMSMAACFLWEDGGEEGEYLLEASGCPELLRVSARRAGDNVYDCQAPLTGDIRVEEDRVYLPGIAHRILPGDPWPDAPERLRAWAQREGGEAYGFIFVKDGAAHPLVYVPGSDTMVWENACGSGMAAAAVLAAFTAREDRALRLRMPGGELAASALWRDGRVSRVAVQGQVRLVMRGTASLDL